MVSPTLFDKVMLDKTASLMYYMLGGYMNFSEKDYLDFQLALSYYCYLKIRDILLKSLCDIGTSDIETIVDNSISNFLGDTDD